MPKAWRPWLVLTALSLFILYAGHRFGGRQGLLWGVVFALGLNAFFYFYSDLFLRPFFKGRSLEGQDPWHLGDLLEKIANRARLPAPQLIILSQNSTQAFALARSTGSSRVYLTEGLLKRFTEAEIEAILAFELALIKRLDTFSMSVASVFVRTSLTVTRSLDWIVRWFLGSKKTQPSKYNHLVTSAFSPLLGLFIRMNLHERDFYAADSLAASWIDDPKNLAQALWKLQSLKQTQPWEAPASLSHLFVVNPLNSRGWTKHLQVQPPVEHRIRKLVGHYPL